MTTTEAPTADLPAGATWITTTDAPFAIGQLVYALTDTARCWDCNGDGWAFVKPHLTTHGMFECQNPRCNPGRNILTVKPYSGMAAQRPVAEPMPLKTTADMFERMAEWTINNLTGDEQDMAVDLVRSVTPHLSREVSAMYWEDLKEAVGRRTKAEAGEYPGDVDELRWAQQCRDAVEFAADMLAGVA